MLKIIAAVADNGVIGNIGDLPWKLRDDLRWFKQQTGTLPVVMGRKTFESLPNDFKPLPNRENLVITRDKIWLGLRHFEPGYYMVSWEEVVRRSEREELFVIGGAEIYALALPLANELYLTRVHCDVPGDTHFPAVKFNDWEKVSSVEHAADERNEYPFTWEVYVRR